MIPKDFLRSIKIAEKVFDQIPEFLKPGVTEKYVAQEIRKRLKEHNAKKESFRIIVASGLRSSLIHGFATEKVIKKNEIVMFDFGALYKDYRSDITRTYFLGKPTKKHKFIFNLLLKAQAAAIKKVKAGAVCKDVDNAARSIIEKAGYRKYFRHSTGHGVRYKTHELPRINGKNPNKLKAGQVVTIEPGIYLGKWGGMRIEDMVLVLKNGCKILTRPPKMLELRRE
ncbi:aminopeptidase P family protein [Candidatus Saganbacteria bacterium]|nr:aminopeptidase P family protein [Candidatus Saganbacteria bacterium]